MMNRCIFLFSFFFLSLCFVTNLVLNKYISKVLPLWTAESTFWLSESTAFRLTEKACTSQTRSLRTLDSQHPRIHTVYSSTQLSKGAIFLVSNLHKKTTDTLGFFFSFFEMIQSALGFYLIITFILREMEKADNKMHLCFKQRHRSTNVLLLLEFG